MPFHEKIHYSKSLFAWVLWPLSLVYRLIITIRRLFLCRFKQKSYSVPIIVVGNISLGGTGKTPLVIALVKALKAKGLKVAVISRGYKAKCKKFPRELKPNDVAEEVGDEPLLIAKNTGVPVVIAPKRHQAIAYLEKKYHPQIIISDDGLQHYSMQRAIEIIVIDGQRGLGNGFCLPAGPLREPRKRLRQADFLVVNSGSWPKAYSMSLEPGAILSLKTKTCISPEELPQPLAALAGIGNPSRFFTTLKGLGLNFNPYPLSDHHHYRKEDLDYSEKALIMTEKDAIKCQGLSHKDCYYLPVEAKLAPSFWQALWSHHILQGFLQ